MVLRSRKLFGTPCATQEKRWYNVATTFLPPREFWLFGAIFVVAGQVAFC